MRWDGILTQMKVGRRAARRKNWSGDKYIFFMPERSVSGLEYLSHGYKYKDLKANKVKLTECVLIHTKNNKVGYYATTQCDMLADDWEVSV